MPLPTTATLEYSITPANVSAADMGTAMGAVTLYSSATADPVLFGLFDCQVASDTTANGPPSTRTIVLNLGAGFFVLFPSAASWIGAFVGLYRYTLAQALCAVVAESTVVFA